jgi:hypothetical protein
MVKRLARFEVHVATAALGDLADLLMALEMELLRQSRLQVFLEELAVPAVPKLERHIDTVPPALATAGLAELLSWVVRHRQ